MDDFPTVNRDIENALSNCVIGSQCVSRCGEKCPFCVLRVTANVRAWRFTVSAWSREFRDARHYYNCWWCLFASRKQEYCSVVEAFKFSTALVAKNRLARLLDASDRFPSLPLLCGLAIVLRYSSERNALYRTSGTLTWMFKVKDSRPVCNFIERDS